MPENTWFMNERPDDPELCPVCGMVSDGVCDRCNETSEVSG